jgi:hypothetical protein
MGVRRKRVKPGDVLLLNVAGGVAYLHYLGRHPEYGDAVLVSRRLDERQASVTDRTFLSGYVAFYPVTAAVAQSLVEVIGHLPPPNLPRRLRRPGARSGRRIDTWIIENGTGETVKSKLSDDELQLPIAVIWNHELLAQRVAEGWNPAQEGRPL